MNIFKTVVYTAVVIILAGCMASKPQIVYKDRSIPVVIDGKHFEYPDTPKPPLSREELKQLNELETIKWQTTFILVLKGHIDILKEKIDSIDKAMRESANKLKNTEVTNESN